MDEETEKSTLGQFQSVRMLLLAALIGGACGGVVGLTLGGITAVLAQLTDGITAVAFGAALFGGGIGGVIGLLAGVTVLLDKKSDI